MCLLHSDNFYRPCFVFITENEFDNTRTYMEGTPIEWLHVSGVRTHRSVKWCLNPLSQHFWKYGTRSITGISGNVSSYEAL